MALYKNIPNFPHSTRKKNEMVGTYDEVPKEMNIFFRSERDFVPEGKEIKSLNKKELELLRCKYRFDYYVPGQYQGITGFGNMIN